MDFATSSHTGVQAQLDRLSALSIPQGRFSLSPVARILAKLGDPHRDLPPAFHVAGTNGKGSTCAFLRAMLEAQGLRVHAFTSPHLIRFNERIRVAGRLIDDEALADLLGETLDAAEDVGASFFEVTTAAAFLAFARTPADACVIEVGLGGRLDATNALPAPAACGIATLGIDHQAFLGDTIALIAAEKAGIAKPGVPLVTLSHAPEAAMIVAQIAAERGAVLRAKGRDWQAVQAGGRLAFDDAQGELSLPLPRLAGAHQIDNAALAVAMLRSQSQVAVSQQAFAQGIIDARWPARLQRLDEGPLAELRPGRALWLDGGHNADAGAALAHHFAGQPPLHLIIGMLANKDPQAIIAPMIDRLLSITALPIPGHEAHPFETFGAIAERLEIPVTTAPDPATALARLPPEGDALIAGSLYLAGKVLSANAALPD